LSVCTSTGDEPILLHANRFIRDAKALVARFALRHIRFADRAHQLAGDRLKVLAAALPIISSTGHGSELAERTTAIETAPRR
jgi:hypothetical protein